jgi:diguanylate cyclase (GGDEF)-like protein/PAS domain S-box-containing protein
MLGAMVLALAVVATVVWAGWRAESRAVGLAAQLQAHRLMQVQAEDVARLPRLDATHPDAEPARAQAMLDDGRTPAGDRVRYTDARGELVAAITSDAGPPFVSASAELPGGGRVTLDRSLRPLIALGVGFGLCTLAAAILGGWALRRPRDDAPAEAEPAGPALETALRQLFDQAPDGILVFDALGRVQGCNPAGARMLGLPATALAGAPLDRWVALPPSGAFTVGQSETQARRGADSRTFPCELTLARLPLPAPRELWAATLRDLTQRRQAEQRMQRLASFDPLTGLPNRSLFRDRLRQAIERASRSGRPMALMFLDLDRFKNVNDSLGHDAGDRLLQHVAAALGAALRGSDSVARPGTESTITVARLGGDEFTIVAEDLQTADDALRIAERVQRALQTPVQVGKHEIVISTSIGITVYPDDASPPDDLLRHADQAMYRAKELGRDQVQFYSAEMNDQAQRRLQLEAELRHALERQEFELVWQPKADLTSDRISGVEALLRWKRDGQPVATPAVFIQVLEETGLILPVGRWVLEQATRQICAWRRAGLPWLRVAVNLSARQLRQGDLLRTVNEVLESSGLPSAQLELELTESMLMGGEHHAQLLHQLSALGVQLAIDDFGTGWSSLSYLKRFNVDTLKIDRSFVRDTPHDPEDSAITTAVIALARSLKLRVVAEGVETPAQRQFLLDNGCDEIQGWLLSRPLSAQAFETWWRQRLLMESGKVVEHSTLP